jgi:hypothetical protein
MDAKGSQASMFELTGVTDLASLTNLASALDSYTCGKILMASVTESNPVTGTEDVETGPYCLVNQKAVLTFRDMDATGTKGPSCVVRIPAPDADLLEMGENGNFVVVPAQGQAIAAIINARLGRNLEFVKGILWNRKKGNK